MTKHEQLGFNESSYPKENVIRRMQVEVIEVRTNRLLVREHGKDPVVIEVDDASLISVGSTFAFDFTGITFKGGVALRGEIVGVVPTLVPEPMLAPETQTPPASEPKPEPEPEPEPELKLESSPQTQEEERVPNLTVTFHKEEGRFTIRDGGIDRTIVNARDWYLLPTDTVSISEVGADKARIERVSFGNPKTVAGYIENEERIGRREGGLVFVARLPGSGSRKVLHKFKFPIHDIPDAEERFSKGKPILFDREARNYIDHPFLRERPNSYKELRWMTLTNLGAYQYDNERTRQSTEEAAELEVLKAKLGIRSADHEAWDAEMEPYLAKLANQEAEEGVIEDFRGKKTFFTDPRNSRDHDDAFSLAETEDGWTEVGIHIADVSRFVLAGSAMDIEAAFRGSTFYLDDLTVRMLDSLLSEHLASLTEGTTRFAFTLAFEALPDEKKGIRIRNLRFTQSVIQVTDGTTYDEAQELLDGEGSDESTLALKKMRDIVTGIRTRFPIRQPGEEVPEDDTIDSHNLVAELMNSMNRVAGAGYERFKRSGKKNVRMVQDVVSGIYRRHEIRHERGEQEFERDLMRIGILTAKEIAALKGADNDFRAVVVEARRRADSGDLLPKAVEAYYEAAFKAGRNASAGYSIERATHFAMGGIELSRMTSPIRRYADLIAQRTLKFLLTLDRHSKDETEDLSDDEIRSLLSDYATEVLGVPLDVSVSQLPPDELAEHVSNLAEERLSADLAHASVREGLSRIAENATAALQTANVLYRKIHGRFWQRNASERRRRAPVPIPLPHGLVIDIPDGADRRFSGDVYGEARISYKQNTDLKDYVSRRVLDQGVSLQVKFKLPEGMPHPIAWCRAQGLPRCQMKVNVSVADVEVEQGRMVLELNPGTGFQSARRERRGPPKRR